VVAVVIGFGVYLFTRYCVRNSLRVAFVFSKWMFVYPVMEAFLLIAS
jgi:hypothetical protein